MEKKKEDALFREWMAKSKLELPFPDFEDTVIVQIKKQKRYREMYSRNIKRSWMSFIAGTVFGMLISVLLPQLQISLPGIGPDKVKLIFQLLFSLFVLFSLDLLIRHTRELGVRGLLNRKSREFQS